MFHDAVAVREGGFEKCSRLSSVSQDPMSDGSNRGWRLYISDEAMYRAYTRGLILIVFAIAPIDCPRSRQPSNYGIIITNGRLCATWRNNRGHKSGHRIYVFAFTARCLFDLVRRYSTTLSNRQGGSMRHMNRSIVSPRHSAGRRTERGARRSRINQEDRFIFSCQTQIPPRNVCTLTE